MARYALVIGITVNDASLGTLKHPLADARAIAQVLQTYGDFRVEVLTSPEETCCAAIAAKLKEFFLVRALRQEALLFYSGHGFPLMDSFGEVEAFLAPADCVVEWGPDAKGKTSAIGQRNGLALRSVSPLAARAELSNLVMLLDCCHSGYLLEEALLKQTFASFIQKDYWLMTACRSFESAYAKRSDQYSLFTGAVLAGLAADRADDFGAISVGELFAFIPKALKGEPQEVMQLAIGRPIDLVRYPLATGTESIGPTQPMMNPYQGLRSFTAATRQFFFGRDREIQALVRAVQDCRFVPVIGASGSGKSSVVRAGLIPRLEELGWRVLPVMMPGTDPIAALQSSIDSVDDSTENTLLVVDQFEEVFTLCRDRSERSKFIQALMNLKLRVVVTMRADFVESCLADAGLTRSIQQDAVYLGPLMGVDLEAAIEQPAIVQGMALQPRLLAQILQDVAAEENCLPLLEFALSQLWERPLTPNSGGTGSDFGFKVTGTEGLSIRELTLTDYRKLGGVVGALNAHAEGIYKQLAVQKREVWVQRVMLKLVRTGEGTKDTRQGQRRDDLLEIAKDVAEREAIESVITALVDGRLLVSDHVDDQDVIDLSHEALMRSWKRFVEWRGNGREVRRIVDAIEDAKRKWIEQGKKRRDLLEGRLLKDGRRSLKDAPAEVFGAKAFIRKSLWIRRSEFASWMIIPILVLGIPAEYSWRENEIKKDYDRIDQLGNGELGERLAVLNIAGGCWAQQQFSIAPEPSMAAELFPEHSKSKDRQYLQLLDNFLKYFRERAFGNCRLLDRANLSGVDLGNDGWINLGKPGLYLGGASLYKANLSGANLVGTNLSNATLDKADLSGASLIGTNLSRANLDRANLSNARLDGTNLSGASFNKGGLMESHLNNVNLSRVSSYAANWSGAKFKSSNLRGASFNQVDLSRANFDRSNLSGASFKVSNLSGANFQGVNLENVEFQCFKYGDQTIPRKGDCTNLKDIKWDKNTNWKNIKGWETVENIPPALKQQLGLK